MGMQVAKEKKLSTEIIHLSGNFIFDDNEAFKQDVLKYIRDSEQDDFEIEISGLDHIDSSGMGLFLLLKEIAYENNKKVSFTGAQGGVRKILKASRIIEIL